MFLMPSRNMNKSVVINKHLKLPPITAALDSDKAFLRQIYTFIDDEFSSLGSPDAEQRYLIYKAVFNKLVDHMTTYRPVLTHIQKVYEDTISRIKASLLETTVLQEKLTAAVARPTTLWNYKKRADELEERIAVIKKENEKLQLKIQELGVSRQHTSINIPHSSETQKLGEAKDVRSIPGLSLEESVDMAALRKKYESLDRQIKELNNSLKSRYVSKSRQIQLKEALEHKVTYRDELVTQSQVYKSRSLRLKIALEAALSYNQVKPPHQTVGDAVILAFHQSSTILKAEKEETVGEPSDAALEDDNPEMEQEAEMMLDYIEKFNELFQDGFFEEAAHHAANSPKGILRTQATLARFRGIQDRSKGRSPLLVFCEALMSTVRATGNKPNDALSRDCVAACLNENRLDIVVHWLAQDWLTVSHKMGEMIMEHCTCSLPCSCGSQAMAENIFANFKSYTDVMFTMLRQKKVLNALQYARHYNCITSENLKDVLRLDSSQELVEGLMKSDKSGTTLFFKLTLGYVLLTLCELDRTEQAASLLRHLLEPTGTNEIKNNSTLSLHKLVALDKSTTKEQWTAVSNFLARSGQHDLSIELLAAVLVMEVMAVSTSVIQDDRKSVTFAFDIQTTCGNSERASEETEDTASFQASPRSESSSSCELSSAQTSPEVPSHSPQRSGRSHVRRSRTDTTVTWDRSNTPPFSSSPWKRSFHAGLGKNSPRSPRIKEVVSAQEVCEAKPDQNFPAHQDVASVWYTESDPYTSNPGSASGH